MTDKILAEVAPNGSARHGERPKLERRLKAIEKKLGKVRGTVQEDGWQTQRYAKKMRSWDMLAQEKMKIIQQLEGL